MISQRFIKLKHCAGFQALINNKFSSKHIIPTINHRNSLHPRNICSTHKFGHTRKHGLLRPQITTLSTCTERNLHQTSVVLAGHSKWSNIKHIKAAQDKERAGKSNMLARQIQAVLTKNPVTDPKLNTELGSLIKWARANSIPNDLIERTIDNLAKLKDPSSLSVFDGRGPANTAIILECFSLKPHHTKMLLQGIVKKCGFNLNAPATDLFDHKGVLEVELPEKELAIAQSNPDNFPLEKYVDIAIEVEAEDVTLERDGDRSFLQFICGPQDLDKVQANLLSSELDVSSSESSYIPTLPVPVSKEFADSVEKLTEKLDIHPDVVKYHFNITLEE